MYKMLSTNRLKMMYLFMATVAWYQWFLQLCIHHPLVNSHNTGGYLALAGKFTLCKRVSNTRLKIMNLFMSIVAWYQRFLQLRIHDPLGNSHNTLGYLADKIHFRRGYLTPA
jgi:hypothetical protein